MIRRIIQIDQDKCNGCGACAEACHESAIGMRDGKAVLLRDDYCDGLGDCLPACPTGAIEFVEREALPYDEAAVLANQAAAKAAAAEKSAPAEKPCGCPGAAARKLERHASAPVADRATEPAAVSSELRQWPVQIKLAPPTAPWFDGARLLVAADCSAYAYADFHRDFIRDHVVLIGCPKLDMVDYSDKLTQIIAGNDIKSVTVVRMEVPCCAGIEHAVRNALAASGKLVPWQVVTLSVEGDVIDRT
jgi:NAD-dependent dihydropyrimidine dehydrogenase PreA subunit